MPDLDIREMHLLRGPNIWANYPVLEAWVDLGSLKDASSEEIPGFNDRLKGWLPGMIEHRCSEGVRGGFFQRLDRGTYPAHILEHVTLELQMLAGHQLGFGKARETCIEGLYKVIVRYLDEVVVQECLRGARELLLAAYTGATFDVEAEVARLMDVVDRNALGPSTKAIVDAARARGIPWRRLQDGRSLIQLGHGVKQRRIWTAETDRTGAIAEYIAQDKDLTRTILRQAGVPVPEGRAVSSVEDAWEAAKEVGLPVVVKPKDGNHGRGVYIDLTTREQVVDAYPRAFGHGSGVMVERYIPGVDHRLLVVGNAMVAANRGEPACVIGDGRQNVRDLIESQLNSDPRRGEHDSSPWSTIDTTFEVDPTMLVDLKKQGHDMTTVPSEGERVLVWRFANPSVDVTDEVHPSIQEHVVVAAKTAGLDISGIDVVCRDISRPLEEQGGAIVEINASPGLNIHLQPAMGQGRPVGKEIIDMLFPEGEDGRIPVIGIAGSHGKTTVVKLLAHLLKATGKFLGVCHSEGLQFGERHAGSKQGDRIYGTQGVLLHPWTEIAICETSAESIILEGVGYDRCHVGVVLNVGTEHLGLGYIDTLEQMTKVKRCVVDIVLPGGTAVLNADDPLVVGMAEYCKGSVLFFSKNATNATLTAHRAGGGRVVFVQDEAIHLAEGDTERRLCASSDVSLPMSGHFAFHLENVLAAIGAAWASGLSDASIAAGLRSYI